MRGRRRNRASRDRRRAGPSRPRRPGRPRARGAAPAATGAGRGCGRGPRRPPRERGPGRRGAGPACARGAAGRPAVVAAQVERGGVEPGVRERVEGGVGQVPGPSAHSTVASGVPTTIAGRSGAAPGRPITRIPSTSCRSPGSTGNPSTRPAATTTRPTRSPAAAAAPQPAGHAPARLDGPGRPALPVTTELHDGERRASGPAGVTATARGEAGGSRPGGGLATVLP